LDEPAANPNTQHCENLKSLYVFQIRIDRLVDKWSGSIEVGITTHNPTALEFPATMTNMRSGTTMMSGCGILTNGKGTRREYGEFNLDELRVSSGAIISALFLGGVLSLKDDHKL